MYLDEVIIAQKNGESKGITSICSAHPWVLRAAMSGTKHPLLIEATCNQVNQFGGYTGMKPANFVHYIQAIAEENSFPFEQIILGGDHLGPSVWQDEPADSALRKAEKLVHDYVDAGFTKIHLDCSMRLADDPDGALDLLTSSERAARLASIAEKAGNRHLRYVIGTEVPAPGGATEHEDGVQVTTVKNVLQTIEETKNAFQDINLESAWERVIAVVVQPGVEFGDDFVLPYQPAAVKELSHFIESQPFIFEAHSTDYQLRESLNSMVRGHFGIIKVGPALTFAFREGVFSLALMENELIPEGQCSNIMEVLDDVMVKHSQYWKRYYHGNEREVALKRKYSLSDRIRYYWSYPLVQEAFNKMLATLDNEVIPMALLKQFVPEIFMETKENWRSITPEQILLIKIKNVLSEYDQACNLESKRITIS
jgi:D-tagatose-1,6-bisphosphate aldolase subunit GatZ/KbaZ